MNTLYTELYNKYLVAVEETEKYPNVGSSRKELLEGIGIDAIGNTIATFDLTTSDIVAQEGNIKADIKSAMTQIETTMKNIAEDEESIVYNESSYKQVLSEYEDAKKLYDEQLSDAIKLLPTPIYEDWQKAPLTNSMLNTVC